MTVAVLVSARSVEIVSIGMAVESTHDVVGFDQPGIDSNSSNASAVKALFIVYPGVETSGERD
jgi:hypothetical protein